MILEIIGKFKVAKLNLTTSTTTTNTTTTTTTPSSCNYSCEKTARSFVPETRLNFYDTFSPSKSISMSSYEYFNHNITTALRQRSEENKNYQVTIRKLRKPR